MSDKPALNQCFKNKQQQKFEGLDTRMYGNTTQIHLSPNASRKHAQFYLSAYIKPTFKLGMCQFGILEQTQPKFRVT